MSARRRVVVLVNDFGPPWDEAGKNNAREAARRLARRHDVVCLGLGERDAEETIDGLRVVRSASPLYRSRWKRLLYALGYARLISRACGLLGDFRPERIVCFWETATTALPAAWLRSVLAPEARLIQVVWTDSYALQAAPAGIWLTEHLPNLLFNGELATGIAIRRVDCVVATSRYLAGRMRAAGARQVFAGGHGVDLERFAPVDSGPRSEGPPVVGYLGHATHAKGLEVLLEAAGPLAERGELELRLALSDSPEAETLRRSVGRGVRIEGYCDPGAFFRGCDLLVFPRVSSYGTASYPNAILEAMACGRCVLTTRQPAIEELVRDGETGVLVAPGDAGALRQAISELLGDAALREGMGGAAREWVTRELGWERALQPIEAALEQDG